MFLEVLGLTYHSPITILAATSGALQRCALVWGSTSSMLVVLRIPSVDNSRPLFSIGLLRCPSNRRASPRHEVATARARARARPAQGRARAPAPGLRCAA